MVELSQECTLLGEQVQSNTPYEGTLLKDSQCAVFVFSECAADISPEVDYSMVNTAWHEGG